MTDKGAFGDLFATSGGEESIHDMAWRGGQHNSTVPKLNWAHASIPPQKAELQAVLVAVRHHCLSWRMAIVTHVAAPAWPAILQHVPEEVRDETRVFLQDMEHRMRVVQAIEAHLQSLAVKPDGDAPVPPRMRQKLASL